MADRPRIAVTGHARRWAPGWWCTALALWLVGIRPIRVSVTHGPKDPRGIAGLIVGGGDDISPEHYGGDVNAKVRTDSARDELEIHWIRWALSENRPVLGICRGAQLINVVRGGSLHADIRPLRNRTSNRNSLLPRKRLRLAGDSRLARLMGCAAPGINSLHHQAVDRVGRGLRAVGWDCDSLIQAIEASDGSPVLGVQWHPEYLLYLPRHFSLFVWLAGEVKS